MVCRILSSISPCNSTPLAKDPSPALSMQSSLPTEAIRNHYVHTLQRATHMPTPDTAAAATDKELLIIPNKLFGESISLYLPIVNYYLIIVIMSYFKWQGLSEVLH